MEQKFQIEINGDSHEISFKYGAVRLLGTFLKTRGYDETVSEVGNMLVTMTEAEKSKAEIPFEITDGLIYTIQAGLYGSNPELEIDFDDVGQAMMQDSEILKTVFLCFSHYMPRVKKGPEEGGKKLPQAKRKPGPKSRKP